MLIPILFAQPLLAATPPQASFTYYPDPPLVNRTITFDSSTSKPGGTNAVIIKSEWNFGDGSPKVTTPGNITTHIFAVANDYTVTLNVTNSEGSWNMTSRIIRIYTFNLSVSTSKARYERSDWAYVNGSFLWIPGNYPVMEGLVGVEIRDPGGYAFSFRTRPTSALGAQNYQVSFTQFFTCDSNLVPKTAFKSGDDIWIYAEWQNHDATQAYNVTTCITALDSNAAPIGNAYSFSTVTLPGLIGSLFFRATQIIDAGILGNTILYGSLFSDLPSNGGYPYCPESTATFTLAPASVSQPATGKSALELSADGTYDLSFRFQFNGAVMGNYTVYASVFYYGMSVKSNVNFTLFTLADINGDGVVDIYDAITLSSAFNSFPGKSNWNPNADINGDGFVDIYDAITLANHYG
jgi:PKD repeat protein